MNQKSYIFEKLTLSFLKLIIAGAFSGVVCWCWVEFFNTNIPKAYYRLGNYLMFAIILVTYVFIAKVYGAFEIGTHSVSDVAFSQIISVFIWLFICYMLFSLVSYRLLVPTEFILLFLWFAFFSVVWAFLSDRIYFALHKPKRTIMVFDNVEAYHSLKEIRSIDRRFKVEKTLSSAKVTLDELYSEILKVDAVFLCGVPSDYRNEVVKFCVANNRFAYVKPKISDTIIHGSRTVQLLNVPVYRCSRAGRSFLYIFVKRVIDIIFALFCIVLSSPFMLIAAIAIKAYDGGPVFYKQRRYTKDKKIFWIYKFRSMKVDAEKDGVARLASENDDRITPVGKLIRKTRIDELPQLFNILGGSMSVVGPRPERPEIFEQYEKTMPEFALRLQVKAGLTGYAQVYGKYNTPPYDKVQMDLMYISKQSVFEDIKLMMLTFKIIFVSESTEGVEAGQVTADRKSS